MNTNEDMHGNSGHFPNEMRCLANQNTQVWSQGFEKFPTVVVYMLHGISCFDNLIYVIVKLDKHSHPR